MVPTGALQTALSHQLPPGKSRPLRPLSSQAAPNELQGRNAYEVLGVSESSTLAEIKVSFHRLAKENHPDVAPSGNASASRRFLVILAAYEILSDPERRAHYDSYLCSEKEIHRVMQKGKTTYTYKPSVKLASQIEVVEWLKCYRLVIDDILFRGMHRKDSGYLNHIQNDLYEAIHAAYYGPFVESLEVLPACFEAEERSTGETSELLHLVSGRDLFGIVHVCNQTSSLCHWNYEKLDHNEHLDDPMVLNNIKTAPPVANVLSTKVEAMPKPEFTPNCSARSIPDAYNDLELHISGQIVASATRVPPDVSSGERLTEDHDIIHVFLKSNEVHEHPAKGFYPGYTSRDAHGSMALLGTIRGLGTSPEEGSCFVYDRSGAKTHLIIKHRTLLVKHMHWFSLGDEACTCECRCRKARLPSSKYWLFQPRCSMHDIGGWYIETFGQDKNGKTILSQRQWDGSGEHREKRLHPAVYLLALAYSTLDAEASRRTTRRVTDVFVPKLLNVLQWCKRLV